VIHLRVITRSSHALRQVTYASDYFDQLFEYAVELIKRGKAYVDHSTKKEMAYQREHKINSPWR
jgi:glutaminyl-tRNA synthetase